MKKLITIALVAAAILSSTLLNAVNAVDQYIAKQNGGMNDPPVGTVIAIKPTGGSNDPPIGTLI